jgi:hypothetical protein
MGIYHTGFYHGVPDTPLEVYGSGLGSLSPKEDVSVHALVVCGRMTCLKHFPLIFLKGSFSSVTLNEGM